MDRKIKFYGTLAELYKIVHPMILVQILNLNHRSVKEIGKNINLRLWSSSNHSGLVPCNKF